MRRLLRHKNALFGASHQNYWGEGEMRFGPQIGRSRTCPLISVLGRHPERVKRLEQLVFVLFKLSRIEGREENIRATTLRSYISYCLHSALQFSTGIKDTDHTTILKILISVRSSINSKSEYKIALLNYI